MFKKLIASIVCISFIFSSFQFAYPSPAALLSGDFSVNQLPIPGTMVGPSAHFVPILLKGLVVHPDKPFKFDFIVDSGNDSGDTTVISKQSERMIKYFLTALTSPSSDLWVNLSPFEHDRIITNTLGQTAFGRDMLAEDYILKQLTASLIYPKKDLGKAFWSRVYKEVKQKIGNTDIPINTFNKVWIVPNGAEVFEKDNAVYITKASLKVMLDEDYLSLQKHSALANSVHSVGSNIIRQIIIPEIEKEVNTGRNFTLLRQIYYATILAKWYREEIQSSIIFKMYVNKNKIAGIGINDKAFKEAIYQRYIRAYKKGVFNYIQEDNDALAGQVVLRKYFSGGTVLDPDKIKTRVISEKTFKQDSRAETLKEGKLYVLPTIFQPQNVNDKTAAMITADQVAVIKSFGRAHEGADGIKPKWMKPGAPLASYEDLREQAARMGQTEKQPMSAKEFLAQDFRKMMTAAGEKIIVFADHQDLDAFISPLTMAYLLHCQLAAVGRADIQVVPVFYGKMKDVDPYIRKVLRKVLGRDIFDRVPFVKKDDLKKLDDNEYGYAVQVDSSGNPVWAVIDHHNKKGGTTVRGPGSRWGLRQGPSTVFLVAQEFKASGLKVDPLIALLALYSTMSDTINFMENLVGSPTIHKDLVDLKEIALSQYKEAIFDWFNGIVYGISPRAKGSDMLRDHKANSYWEQGEEISQRFFIDRTRYLELLPDIIKEIRKRLKRSGDKVWIHMGTDVERYESLVMVVPGEGYESLEGPMAAVLSEGGTWIATVDGIRVYVREEMLRKNLAENKRIKFQMKAILSGNALPKEDHQSGEQDWWHTASGIFTYARSRSDEGGWTEKILAHYSDNNDPEMRAAISMMLLCSDDNIRRGASWIASQRPALLGPIDDERIRLFHDQTLWGVISSGLPDNEVHDILLRWYMKRVHPHVGYTDYFFMDLFFNHLQTIILREHGTLSLRYIRARALIKDIAKENQNEPDLASELRGIGLTLKAGTTWRKAIEAVEGPLGNVGSVPQAEVKEELRRVLSEYFDMAMTNTLKFSNKNNAHTPSSNEGGIDLNGININRRGKLNPSRFDQAQITSGDDFGGLSPRIIMVTPIFNLLHELSVK